MTGLEKLLIMNRHRVRTGPYASTEVDGFNGHFIVHVDGEMYHLIISDGMGWKHVSIRNAQKKILPSWPVMCRVKDLFFGDDEWCVQFHPSKADHVNDHPFCLHLWMPLNETLPKPSIVLV